jgi:hypothetical protein
MMFQEAQRLLEQFLAPLTLDEFLDRTLSGGFIKVDANATAGRTSLLGADPESVLLGAFQLAPQLIFESASPSGPAPELQGVAGAADFQQRITQLHERGYSVRFPELRALSPQLDRLARALEILLHQPVTAAASWSRGAKRAAVRYEDHDLLIVQLRGTRRWEVASRPSELSNTWKRIVPDLGPHQTLDLKPGDLLYLPRGSCHSVDADNGSLHLAIGFTPLTVRAAVIAALDHLSDLDPGWRRTLGARLAFQLRGTGMEQLTAPIVQGAAALLAACQTPGYLDSALQWRSSRAIAALDALTPAAAPAAIGLDTELQHNELAFCHLTASPERIDVSYPGGHLFIHRGAQPAVEFMVNAPRFRVRDIPGEIGDDVRISLAERFVGIGFLRRVPARTPAAPDGA